ncbi:MAG: UpxY family transcription antiterminator [Ferruginibacter sp.]
MNSLYNGNFPYTRPAHNANEDWYIFYTYPRAEKIIETDLLRRGYNVYLPTCKNVSYWKNRQRRIIEKALFPSYIFVKTTEAHLFRIAAVPKVVTFLKTSGKASTIPEEKIAAIRSVIATQEDIEVKEQFNGGDLVIILSGPLSGLEGRLISKIGKKRFAIQIDSLNRVVLVDISETTVFKRIVN